MFKKLSREDILTELAVIQDYIDKLKDDNNNHSAVAELESHKEELIESLCNIHREE